MAIPFRKSKGLLQLRLQPRPASNIPSHLGLQSTCKASTNLLSQKRRLEFQKLLQDGSLSLKHFQACTWNPIETFISRTEGLKDSNWDFSSSLTNLTSSNLTSNEAMPAMPTTTFQPRHVTPPPPRNAAMLPGHGSDAKNSACLGFVKGGAKNLLKACLYINAF